MNIKQIRDVMKKYGEAWENKDSDLILKCFTKESIYLESPLVKPYKGHKEIKRFWDKTVCKDTTKIKFKLGRCYVSKDSRVGFAEWKCKNIYKGKVHNMVGIIVLKMRGNKIAHLNEYWNTKIA